MSDTSPETIVRLKTRKIGVISMGITLVAIGVVMLCTQLGWLSPSEYRWLLPAYLVVLGSETLAVRLLANRKSPGTLLTPAVGSVVVTLGVLLFVRLWVAWGSRGFSTWMYW